LSLFKSCGQDEREKLASPAGAGLATRLGGEHPFGKKEWGPRRVSLGKARGASLANGSDGKRPSERVEGCGLVKLASLA